MSESIYGLVKEYSRNFENIIKPKERFIKALRSDSENMMELFEILFDEITKSMSNNDISVKQAIAISNYGVSQASAICLTMGVSEERLSALLLKNYYDLDHSESIDEVLKHLRLCLLTAIDVSRSKKEEALKSEVIENCVNFIKENITFPLTLKSVSDEMNYTPAHISHKFNEEMHIGINDYIANQKIEEAKRLLMARHTVNEASEMLAYSSTGHFIKVFKKVTGITPKQYQMWLTKKDKVK